MPHNARAYWQQRLHHVNEALRGFVDPGEQRSLEKQRAYILKRLLKLNRKRGHGISKTSPSGS